MHIRVARFCKLMQCRPLVEAIACDGHRAVDGGGSGQGGQTWEQQLAEQGMPLPPWTARVGGLSLMLTGQA